MTVPATVTPARKGTPLDALRAFGVMSGGVAVLFAAMAASTGYTVVSLAQGEAPPWPAVAGVIALLVYLVAYRPWTRRWGVTDEEVHRQLPGDEAVVNPGIAMTRAVTIDVPIDDVWPWLAQIGQDRGGFYSYSWLENLAGCHLHNADRIHREWQHRHVGEIVLLHPLSGIPLSRFEPPHAYALAGWYFALEALGDRRTRLYARTRVPRGFVSLAYAIFVELPHFIMERKMLLGIKRRAEHAAGNGR